MGISRRSVLAIGSAAAAAPTAGTNDLAGATAPSAGANGDILVQEAVERLSWMFPQPCNSTTQIGFRIRRGELGREIKAYFELFQDWFGGQPTLDHLCAAGAVIYKRPEFKPSQRGASVVSEETFSSLWSVAHRRVIALPEPSAREYRPFPERTSQPAPAVQIEVAEGGPAPTILNLQSARLRQFWDVAEYLGGPGIALEHAIAHLWEDLAFTRGRGSLSRTPGGKAPTPTEAWRMINRRSRALRRAVSARLPSAGPSSG